MSNTAKTEPEQKPRSFTIRVPHLTYIEIATLAQNDDVNLNHKVNQLLRLGLGEHVSLDAALRRLLGTMAEEKPDVGEA